MIRMSKKLISLFLIFGMMLPIFTTPITANAVSVRKPRIVILRLDDLKANDTNFENFDRAKEILDKYGANAGFGKQYRQ